MSIIVKGGLATAVLAVGCTGTYFLMTGKGSGPITLKAEAGTDADYNGKIGKDFEYFLVSPFNEKNRSFWDKAFKKWEEESTKANSNLSNEFKKDEKVKTAFTANKTGSTNDDDKALNRVCHNLYTGKVKNDLSISESEADKKKLTTDLFAYCSVLGGLPTTIQNPTDNTIGKTNQTKLVATAGNYTWWELKTKEFFGGSASDAFFSPFHAGKRGSLRTKCEEAYGKEANTSDATADKPKSEDVLKYCSLLGS